MWRVAAASVVVALGVACAMPDVFFCSEATQCVSGEVEGVCEPTGYCSFPDAVCASGRRYGSLAPADLAGACVEPGPPIAQPDDGEGGDGATEDENGESSGGSDPAPPPPGRDEPDGDDPPLPYCGDGAVDAGETCDDGNELDGDTCNRDCTRPGQRRFALEVDLFTLEQDDRAYAVTVLPDDTFAFAGLARGAEGPSDAIVGRADTDGEVLWVTRQEMPGSDHDHAWGIGVHPDQRIIAVGQAALGATAGTDVLIMFADQDGNLGNPYEGSSGGPEDVAFSLAFDDNGEYVVTGSRGDAGQRRGWTRRYTPTSPDTVWEADDANYGPNGGDVSSYAIALDGAGNAYLTGAERTDTRELMFVRSLDPDGAVRWTRWGVEGSRFDRGRTIAVSASGDVLVGGVRTSDDDELVPAVFAFGADAGAPQWERVLAEGHPGKVESLAEDDSGGIAVAGIIDDGGEEDAFVCKLAPVTHSESWCDLDERAGIQKALGLALDSTGDIIAVGYTDAPDAEPNTLLWKYSP